MLLPLAGMAAIVFFVWLRLYQLRFGEMLRRKIDPQAIATSSQRDGTLVDSRGSDNYKNLFELPVLFYAAVLATVAAGLQDSLFLSLAWIFVGLRALHSLIQCSYNRVVHRFTVFALGALLLFAYWARLGWMLASA